MIRTDRLWLRRFEPRDRDAFASLNADPQVMRHFIAPLSSTETDALLARIASGWQGDGIALAAVERLSDGVFLGMVGLAKVRETSPALDEGLEIGWRLARAHWRQGYATEAAGAWLSHGLALTNRVVAFTTRPNLASQTVMNRIGMVRDPGLDFDHPRIPSDHPLCRHLVWRADRA